MDKTLARALAVNAIKATSLLNSLNVRLKDECTNDEYRELIKTLASISGEISIELLSKIFVQYPDLESEIDNEIGNTGKVT